MSSVSPHSSAAGTSLPLLPFLDAWSYLETLEVKFEQSLSAGPSSSSLERDASSSATNNSSYGLEVMRGLDAERRAACMKQAVIGGVPDTDHLAT